MTDPKRVRLVCLIDRTGSMNRIKRDVEGAFDAFMDEQQTLTAEAKDNVEVDLYQFDAPASGPVTVLQPWAVDLATTPKDWAVETVYQRRPLAQVPSLTITPRGGTPLSDAMAWVIQSTGWELALLPESERPGKVIVVVATDGEENSSLLFPGDAGREQVRAMVTHQEQVWKWQFEFLAVGIDGVTVAGGYGISGMHVNTSDRSRQGIHTAYAGSSANVSRSRLGDRPPVVSDASADEGNDL